MPILNKFLKFIKDIFKNLLVQVITGAIITSSILYIFWDFIITNSFIIANMTIQLWIVLLIIFISILSFIFLKKFFHKKPLAYSCVARSRTGREVEIPFDYLGVKWLGYTPRPEWSQSLQGLLGKDEYVWITGHFCSDCKGKLKVKKYGVLRKIKWFCERCDKFFDRPSKKEYEIKESVKDILHTEIYRKNKFENKL